MTDTQIKERQRQNAELAVWGLKKAILSKRQEIVDLELELRKAQDQL
jgi:hypothetical protein